MRIKTIRLSNNYKRFYDLTIQLGEQPKKIIALVGPNGSGKSSVFDGMIFLNSAHQAIGNMGRRDFTYHSMIGQEISHESIEITFDNGLTFPQARAARTQSGQQNTIFSFRNSYRYSSTLNVTQLQALADTKSNSVGASTSADLDDKITYNYQQLYSYIDRTSKKSELNYAAVRDEIIGQLNAAIKACLDLQIIDHGDIQAGKGTLILAKTDQDAPFNFNVLSAGEKEIIDILLDIFLKKETYGEAIFIIDEPELHLSTKIQKILLIELDKMIPENCQLWIATHSLGFLNALQNELSAKSDVIYFVGNYTKEPVTLNPIQKTRSEWQKIFSTALEDMTGLLAPRVIIYCEGKPQPAQGNSEDGVDALIYNKIFEKEYPEIMFVSSGGQTQPDKHAALALKILNKAFTGVELLLLKDRDINGDGTETTLDQRLDFLREDQKRNRMLVRKEIEDYLLDFEIISAAYVLTQENYDAAMKGRDAKSSVGDMMRACGIATGKNKKEFLLHLADFVTANTAVYQELKEAIFQV